jgi:hypothetical protein
MNVNKTCNASWNGTTVNFFRSGNGCSNTGEIAAVFLHEWRHGLDQNTGGAAPDKGTGEAVGDTFAFLETRDSCIGRNFQPGITCHNCDNACTGVHDVASFAAGGGHTIARPSTVTSPTGLDCGRVRCPYSVFISPYQGPMGYEGHCESYIASSANWDLAQQLVARWGTTTGWQKMDAIWYKSLTPSKSAYQVAAGGKCNPAATVNGCGATNWYTVFLPADDDDGNLANGTPTAAGSGTPSSLTASPAASGRPARSRWAKAPHRRAKVPVLRRAFRIAGDPSGGSRPAGNAVLPLPDGALETGRTVLPLLRARRRQGAPLSLLSTARSKEGAPSSRSQTPRQQRERRLPSFRRAVMRRESRPPDPKRSVGKRERDPPVPDETI